MTFINVNPVFEKFFSNGDRTAPRPLPRRQIKPRSLVKKGFLAFSDLDKPLVRRAKSISLQGANVRHNVVDRRRLRRRIG